MYFIGFRTFFLSSYWKELACNFKIFSVVSVCLFTFLFSGCAPRSMIKPEAFGTKKTFAIVSIAGAKHFNAGSKTTKEFFTGYDDSNNTQPILDKMKVDVWKALKKSNHFRLKDPKKVRSSQVYKGLEPDEAVFRVGIFKTKMNTAKGYKYFSDKKKLAKLAKELRVDGVIQVIVNLSTRDTTIYAVGFGAKTTRVLGIIGLFAYDRNGNVIWQDMIQQISEEGLSKAMILVDTGNINYKKLIPLAEKVAQEGIKKIVANLDDKMGSGKNVQRHAKK